MVTENSEDAVVDDASEIDAEAVIVTLSDDEPTETESDDITVEEGDTTVVVTTDDNNDAVDAVVLDQVIDDAVTLAVLNERVSALEGKVFALEVTATAEESEDDALDERIDDIAEDMEETADESEDDEDSGLFESSAEPKSAKPHPLFRSFSDWRNK